MSKQIKNLVNQWLLIVLMIGSPLLHATSSYTVTSEQGQQDDLMNYIGQGKWTVVMIWALDCAHCQQQKPEFSAFHQRHKDKDANVVGLVIDGVGMLNTIKSNLQQRPVSFPNLVTNRPALREFYLKTTGIRFQGTPSYLFYSPQGELKSVTPGTLDANAVDDFLAGQ